LCSEGRPIDCHRSKLFGAALDAIGVLVDHLGLEGERITGNGVGYISPADVPAGATGFWIPDSPLKLDVDDRDKRGYYTNHRHLSYVGTEEEVDVIQAGQLVRVSLARWWKPRDADPSFEERCYAQISGWY